MTQPQLLTVVTLVVPQDREEDVVRAYRELTAHGPRPEGLLRSELLRAGGGRWLIQTVWRDRAAIMAARAEGAPPAALVLAEQLGAEHSHELFTVEGALDA